jgi:pimeloyl-ACP methyl ester carboxylesterase
VRGEFLDVGGVRLYYYAAGSRGAGEPIVLIHGFPTSSHLWRDVVPLLPEGHRVVVVDLLGFGRSDPPGKSRMDVHSHADRVLAMMDLLRIDVACVAGHHLGGAVAQSLATRWPHRVSRMCLVSSVALSAWPTAQVRLARALLPITRRLPASWLLSLIRSEMMRGYRDHELAVHDIDRFLRSFESDDGMDALFAQLAELESSETAAMVDRLREIDTPVALVWGEHDPFVARRVGDELTRVLRRGTLQVVPGGRHFVPRDAPHAVAGAIATLLAR